MPTYLSFSPSVLTSHLFWYSSLMKPINTLLTIIFISLLSSPSWSENFGDLVKRDGLFYKKFTDVPFSGEVTGDDQGSVKNGEKDGAWISYYRNGQLRNKINWKNGKRDGAWVVYHENSQLRTKGNYKNGKYEGAKVDYYENGQLSSKGNHKNGKSEGAWVYYYENGQLAQKGNQKIGKMEGAWVAYQRDGTVWKKWTGTFKNDVKISD